MYYAPNKIPMLLTKKQRIIPIKVGKINWVASEVGRML